MKLLEKYDQKIKQYKIFISHPRMTHSMKLGRRLVSKWPFCSVKASSTSALC